MIPAVTCEYAKCRCETERGASVYIYVYTLYSRFLQTCRLRGFTFTFTVRIIVQFLYQDDPRSVQKLNNNSHNKCTSKSPKTTRLRQSAVPIFRNLKWCIHLFLQQVNQKGQSLLQLQEFSLRKQTPVASSTSAARLLLLCSNLGLEIFSPRLQLYILILT
jgi:hypothetical protein